MASMLHAGTAIDETQPMPGLISRHYANAPSEGGWLAAAILYAPLIGVTLLAKAAIPPLGERSIGISLLVVYLAMAVGALSHNLAVEPKRLAFFLLVIATLGLESVLHGEGFSVASLLLLAALHLPYVFFVTRAAGAATAVAFFTRLCAFLAGCALAQFLLQFFIDAKYVFPIENFVPQAFVVQGFNAQAPLSYGSQIYRATGIFLFEPSYLSQLLAIGIVTELCTRHRLTYLLLYALAIIVSYSGTGLVILAVCVPVIVVVKRRWAVLLAGLGVLLLLSVLRQWLFLDQFAARAGEFGATGSSGFARFISGFYLFDRFLWNDPGHLLFGLGAGTFKLFAQRAVFPTAEMPLFKMVMEFGLVGALLYFAFILYCLFSSPLPRMIALAVALAFLLNGLYVPFALGPALALLVWPSRQGSSFAARPVAEHYSAAGPAAAPG